MKLLFYPEVPTGSHVRTYNSPTHKLTVCTTHDMILTYTPLVLKRNKTSIRKTNKMVPELQIIHDCHPMYDLVIFFSLMEEKDGIQTGNKFVV